MGASGYNLAKKERLKAAGLCTNCGTKPSDPERSKCTDCRSAIRREAKLGATGKPKRACASIVAGTLHFPGNSAVRGVAKITRSAIETSTTMGPRKRRKSAPSNCAYWSSMRMAEPFVLAAEYVFLTLDHINNDGADVK